MGVVGRVMIRHLISCPGLAWRSSQVGMGMEGWVLMPLIVWIYYAGRFWTIYDYVEYHFSNQLYVTFISSQCVQKFAPVDLNRPSI